ncbi:FAD binding domain-containing protein [Byssothecium circinans]|uniref:FAD binding domain-containing protein n=1 Tax=Byssothecium circinans TaxID=147558 RepID=A0A6A5UB06_9PLEO|nr:FAD binding domain-containing protein [Byssothecium circinans]
MVDNSAEVETLPVLIIGAGISGLLLAQQFRNSNVPFQVFERDSDFSTRGFGWGLTLHWSLPALRELLSGELLAQLPDTYVDRAAVERGETSTFPFFDLSTGELKGQSPRAPENQRIRVTREKLRRLLATGIEVKWGKSFEAFEEDEESVNAIFEDGTTVRGRMIFGCDGSHSRVRRALLPSGFQNHRIPVRMFGFTMLVTAEQSKPIRELDPFFLQGTASASDVFMYISLLQAPQTPEKSHEGYLYQVCISWDTAKGLPNSIAAAAVKSTPEERPGIIRKLAEDWAEPFRSFVRLISNTVDVKQLDLDDFPPGPGIHPITRVLLIGDAFHAMAMYRGEGANHVIVDVLELKEKLLPQIADPHSGNLHEVLPSFLDGVIARTLPAVLASRQACLDAHDYHGLTPKSPLLTKRQMQLDFKG